MLKKIGHSVFQSPDEIGFDNYLILIGFFFIGSLGLLGTLINIFLNLGLSAIISTLIPTFIGIPIYIYNRLTQKFIFTKYLMIILCQVLVNLQWFINYGSTGPIPYLFVVLESFIIIFFKKKVRILFTVLVFINVTILYYIEFMFPALIGEYSSRTDRLLDLYMGMLIYLFISILLLNIAMKFYIKQREKAELADKLKSAFLANMSHEIRTPMNGILGFADLLKSENLSKEIQQKYIGIIEKSGAHMLSIINDIIDISKIESGLMEIHPVHSNINEQIEYTYTFFKPESDLKRIILLYKKGLPSKDALIKTDREKIYAVLTNLVKNAIKYTNQGIIEFGYERKGSYIEFFVRDTGIGIPNDRQAAIFERFVQADISNKTAKQGAGLGLAIAKAYVEMLGGKIWVESQPGKGSCFFFTLPYNAEQAEKANISPDINNPQENYKFDELKILIAEDDEVSESLVEAIVKPYGKEILTVKSGEEVVDVCRNKPDLNLILMDIQLPEINGYEATSRIRKFNKDVIIIAQTAFGLAGDRDKALQAGCNDYISKPILKNELLSLIQKHLSR